MEGTLMKKRAKDKYRDMPIGKLTVIPDFLPPPDQLILPGQAVKITISLDQESLLFFKEMAAKLGTKYQRMIREVLRRYAQAYQRKENPTCHVHPALLKLRRITSARWGKAFFGPPPRADKTMVIHWTPFRHAPRLMPWDTLLFSLKNRILA